MCPLHLLTRALLATAFVLLPARALAQTWTDFQVGGLTRKALVYVPDGIQDPPLLISLHGMGIGAGWHQAEMMKFEPIADREKFIVVYPEADQDLRWDLGGTHDTDFISVIIDEMSAQHGIDRDRVYASGFSMGGMFSYTLACKMPDKIAAIAPGNGYPLGGGLFGCTGTRPVPVFHMHGTADDFVAYSGIHAFLGTLVDRYGCPPTPERTEPYPISNSESKSFTETWGPCIDGSGQASEIVLVSVTGMIHDWATAGKPNANEDPAFTGKPFDIDGSEEAWAFLKTHSLAEPDPASVVDAGTADAGVADAPTTGGTSGMDAPNAGAGGSDGQGTAMGDPGLTAGSGGVGAGTIPGGSSAAGAGQPPTTPAALPAMGAGQATGAEDDPASGCSCRIARPRPSPASGGWWLLAVIALAARRRRARTACAAVAAVACLFATGAHAQSIAGGSYQLKNGSQCLASGASGAPVVLAACAADAASGPQAFILSPAAGDAFVVQSRGNAEVLDISGGSGSPGAELITWPANGQDNQRFALEARGADAYELRPQHATGLCLTAQADGTVQLTACNAATSEQAWELVEVELPDGGQSRDCTEQELYQPWFVENLLGGPRGANVAIMTGGYMLVIFAPDSGGPPGIIHVYDVSDPRHPVLRTRIDDAHTARFREAHSLPIARIGTSEYVAIQTIDGIQFWDLSDPLEPSYLTQLDLPGVAGGDYENVAWQADWQGRHLYVAGANQGLYVIDAHDPTSPELLAQVPTGRTGGFRIGPLMARGPYLVIGNMDQNGAYSVLDISRPAQPALLSTFDRLPRLYTMSATGDRIYGAGRDGDFTIHSFDNPTSITEVSTTRIEQDSLYVAAQDHFVFSGRQENFVKLDVSDEQNVEIVGEGTVGRSNTDHGQVTPMGNWIFIGNDHGTGSAFFCHAPSDDLPLAVQKVFPADGSTHQDPTTAITIVLSDYLDTTTVGPSTVAVRPSGGEAVDGIYTYNFNTLSFSPHEPFAADTTYEIVMPVDGIRDVSGHPLAEEVLVRFSTGDNVVIAPPPTVEPDDPAMVDAGDASGPDPAGSGGGPAPGGEASDTADAGASPAPTAVTPSSGMPEPASSEADGGCTVGAGAHPSGASTLWLLLAIAALWRRRMGR